MYNFLYICRTRKAESSRLLHRMLDEELHEPFAQPFSPMIRMNDHIANPRKRSAICQYPHKTHLFRILVDAKANSVRISIIRTDEHQIEKGVQLIGEWAEHCMRTKKATRQGAAYEWM